MNLDTIAGWLTLAGGGLLTTVLGWVLGGSRARRQVSIDSVVVANNDQAIDMMKTLQEREAKTNERANRLAEKERETFEKYMTCKGKLEMAERDLARLRDKLADAGIPQSDWGDIETNLGDLPK